MTRRRLNEQERKAVVETAPIVADLFVRLGRDYVSAVRAQPGQTDINESRFARSLGELFVMLAESGALD